jgi:hypothetical protein
LRILPWLAAPPRPPGDRPPWVRRISAIDPMISTASRAKLSGRIRKRMRLLIPEPDDSAGAAGLSTVTPSARRLAARSNAPGIADGEVIAAAGEPPKSRPAFGRGICAAITWPLRSVAATQ